MSPGEECTRNGSVPGPERLLVLTMWFYWVNLVSTTSPVTSKAAGFLGGLDSTSTITTESYKATL